MKAEYDKAVDDFNKRSKTVRQTYPGSVEITDLINAGRRVIIASRPAESKPGPETEIRTEAKIRKPEKPDGGN